MLWIDILFKKMQNTIIKVTIKELVLEKNNTGKKLNQIYIVCETVSCSALFTSGCSVNLV